MRHERRSRPFLFLLCIGSTCLVPACGSREKTVTCHPVEGRVLHGNQPVVGARVTFAAIDVPTPPDVFVHPTARTDAEGHFKLRTFKEADGAPAGKYKVLIVWPKTPGRSDGSGEGEEGDRLEGRFATPETSTIEVEIKPETNNLPPFVVD